MRTPLASPEPEILEPLHDPDQGADTLASRTVDRVMLLWHERRLIGRATLGGLLAALLLALVLPKRYEATARLMPPDNQSSSNLAMLAALSSRASGGLGSVAGDVLGLKTSGALFVGVLRSRTLQDRLVQRFDLKDEYWKSFDEDARAKLASNTAVSEDRKSGIITITVTASSAQRSADLANAHVEELNRMVTHLSTSAAHRERVFIEQRLAAVKTELDAAAKELSEFASKNAAIDIREQGRAMMEAAATLQGSLIAAQSELEGLLQIYTTSNVRVRSVQARIEELKRQLETMGGSSETGPSSDGAIKKNTPASNLYPKIRDLPRLGVTYADLYRKTKIQETVFELLTQQYELAKVQEAKETPSVKVLDSAVPPDKSVFPPRLLLAVLGSMVAFSLAASWILLRTALANVAPSDPGKILLLRIVESGQRMTQRFSRRKGSHG